MLKHCSQEDVPSVAVILATFNGERFLREQLDSIQGQSILPDELVIYDDASTDSTVAIIKSFAKRTNVNVKLIEGNLNNGISRSLGLALAASESDLVFICDQDDIWFSNKISSVLKIFCSNHGERTLCCIHDAMIVDEKLSVTSMSLLSNVEIARGSREDFVSGCCTTMRRKFAEIVFPVPGNQEFTIGYDEWIHLAAKWLGGRMVIGEPLIYYRRHISNLSSAFVYKANVSLRDRLSHYWMSALKAVRGEELNTWLRTLDYLAAELERRLRQSNYGPEYIADMQALRRAIRQRILMRSIHRYKRWFQIVRFASSGGYARFSGWKSVFVDILQR